MQHTELVGCAESCTNLPGQLQCFIRRQMTNTPQQRRKVLAVDVFHGEKMNHTRSAGNFFDVVHPANIGVRNLPRRSHLAVKLAQRGTFSGKSVRQYLQSYQLPKLEVFGLINVTHSTATQETNDAITFSQKCPRDKSPAIERTCLDVSGFSHQGSVESCR